jgi:hypothetical protein
VAALLLFAGTCSAADYYVSAQGDDDAPGSKARPWKSIAPVNQLAARPGDRILFEAGAIFVGNVVLNVQAPSSATKPVIVSSYGNGRATIDGGTGTAILVQNTGGVIVENLTLRGQGRPANTGSGVRVINTLAGNVKLSFIRIRRVDAAGFGRAGIFVGGLNTDGQQSGFEDVRIENCEVHDNTFYGILVGGPWDDDHTDTVTNGPQEGSRPGYTNKNVYIGNCRAWRNEGDPTYKRNHSGNGIVVADTDGAIIERCTAWENGRLCLSPGGGPGGIWAAGSNRVTIQHCESFRNHTGLNTADGDGFDLDGGETNSVVQYNYSHDNDGFGFLLCNYKDAPHEWRNNVLRFNISDNDGRDLKANAAICFWTDEPELADIEVYHNTVLVDPAANGNLPAVLCVSGKAVRARLCNNIFMATSGCPLLDNRTDASGLRFQGNAYWTEAGPVRLLWAGQEFASLDAWRNSTGQEILAGKPVGLFVDPLLTVYGRGMTVSDVLRLPMLPAYHLRPGSPLIGKAEDLSPLNIGKQDFFGNSLVGSGPLNIGACATTGTPPGKQ